MILYYSFLIEFALITNYELRITVV